MIALVYCCFATYSRHKTHLMYASKQSDNRHSGTPYVANCVFNLSAWFSENIHPYKATDTEKITNIKIEYTYQNADRVYISFVLLYSQLKTHWGRVTHICFSKLTIIGSDNGLSPGRRQAIIWANAGILLIGALGTNFKETSNEIHTFSFNKIHLKLSSGKWRPFCLGLNVLNVFAASTVLPEYGATSMPFG